MEMHGLGLIVARIKIYNGAAYCEVSCDQTLQLMILMQRDLLVVCSRVFVVTIVVVNWTPCI